MRSRDGLQGSSALSGGSAPLALVALTAALAPFAACLPRGHGDIPAQSRAGTDLAALLPGAQPARSGGANADDGNRLGDTPAPADDYSRLAAQLASETGVPHLNDVAQRIRYNGAYFEIDIEVNGQDGARAGIVRGIVPVVWDIDPADKAGTLTRAGRALQKHGSRPGSAFPAAQGNPAQINQQGQKVLDDILSAPGAVTRSGNRFGGIDVIAPGGRGARFDAQDVFRGFLEP